MDHPHHKLGNSPLLTHSRRPKLLRSTTQVERGTPPFRAEGDSDQQNWAQPVL